MIVNEEQNMGAAALTEYQGHQEYEESLARMAATLGVQVEYLRDYISNHSWS